MLRRNRILSPCRCLQVVAVALWMMALVPSARAATTTFSIDPQDLSGALKAFAVQSHREIFFAPELARGRRSKGVNGTYDDLKALNIILEGTGLDFSVTTSNAILVRDPVKGDTWRTPSTPATSVNQDQASSEIRMSQTSAPAHDEGKTARTPGAPDVSSGGADKTTITEIIVTAQKKSERLQDVPVPVSVLNAQTLVETNQLRLQDYFTSVPGLSVTPDDARGTPQLTIRGITTGGYTNPTVGIVVDDVAYGATTNLGGGYAAPDIDPSDLARVEVLRGPQGTLYGANSIGGLLKFVTIDPSTDGVSGRLQAGTTSVYNGDGLGYNYRGAVNVPLSDTFAVRASAFTRRDPGYIDDPINHLDGVNRLDASGGRLSALWRPSDAFSLKLSALIQDTKRSGSPDVDVQTGLGDLQQNDAAGTGSYDKKTQAYSATLKAKLGVTELTAISGYSINQLSDSVDFSVPYSQYALAGIPGTGFNGFGVSGAPIIDHNKTSKFTQELRLSMPLVQKLEWLIGAFYTHEDSPYDQQLLAANFTTGQIVGSLGDFNFPTTYSEYAVFTDLTVHFSEQFDVQFGGRESRNRQTYSEVDTGPLVGGISINPEVDTKDNSFTYLVTPRFKLSSDLMVYARLASGYRPGGPNPTCILLGVPCQYGPDKTTNYEVGIKGDALDRVLSFDASLYYIDWRDIQLTLIDPSNGFQYYGNAGRAKSEGVEFSVEARPAEGLNIATWIAWNDATLSQSLPAGPPGLLPIGNSGDRLPASSRISGSLSLEQEFSLSGSWRGFAGGALSYVGDRLGVFTTSPERQRFPSYAKTDLRAGVKYDLWTANLFVNNIADKRGLLAGGLGTSPNPNAFNYIQPRTIGLSLSRVF